MIGWLQPMAYQPLKVIKRQILLMHILSMICKQAQLNGESYF